MFIQVTTFAALLVLQAWSELLSTSSDSGHIQPFIQPIDIRKTLHPDPNTTTDQQQTSLSDGPLVIVVAVISSAANMELRSIIRSTWGTFAAHPNARLKFVVGRAQNWTIRPLVAEEAEQHGDMWVGDFLDTYRNLSLKSGLVLSNALEQYPEARLLLKIDDDSFLNPVALVNFINREEVWDRPIIFGKLYPAGKVRRDPMHKHWVTMDLFPDEFFPPYVDGVAYLISMPGVEALRDCVLEHGYLPMPFPVEDVLVTGICAVKADVPRYHRVEFNYSIPTERSEYRPYAIVVHNIPPMDNFHYWKMIFAYLKSFQFE